MVEIVSDILSQGGAIEYLLLLMTLFSGIGVLVLTFLGVRGSDPPSFLWYLGPLTCALLTGAGMVSRSWSVFDHLLHEPAPEARQRLLAGGVNVGDVLNVGYLGGFTTALVCGLAAVGCALAASLGASGEADWSIGWPVTGGVLLIGGLIGMVNWMYLTGPDGEVSHPPTTSYLLVGTLLGAGLACLVSALRASPEESDADREARYTLATGALFVLAVAAISLFGHASGTIEIFQALAGASPENREKLMQTGLDYHQHYSWFALPAVGLSVLVGAVSLLGNARRMVTLPMLARTIGVVAVIAGTIGLFAFGVSQLDCLIYMRMS